MPKNPYINCLFDHIDGFEFFLFFWVANFSCLPFFQEGASATFLAVLIIAPNRCY